MDWKQIREELSRLTALVEGWSDGTSGGLLERELVLEKLRAVYEAIRFAEVPAPAMPAVQPQPQEQPEQNLETAPASADAETSVAVPESDVPAAEEPQPVAEETSAAPAEELADPVAPEATDAPAEESADPHPGEQPTEPEVAAELETSAAPAADAQPRTTLFDPEEDEAMRHRRKQRVIMSLYGDGPEMSENVDSAAIFETEETPESSWNQHAAHPERAVTLERFEAEKPRDDASVMFEEVEVETIVVDEPAEITPFVVPESETPSAPEPEAEPEAKSETEPTPVFEPEETAFPEPEEMMAQPAPELEETPPSVAEPESVPDPESESEPEPELLPEPQSVEEQPAEPETFSEEEQQPEPEPEPEPIVEVMIDPEPASAPEPAPAVGGPTPVLGEMINHNVQTLADTIVPPMDVASSLLRNEAISDLRQAIGLNDKFLLIRDLFDGDGVAYERTIRQLNGFDNLDDCMIYLAENFTWNANSDSVRMLMELLERKFA